MAYVDAHCHLDWTPKSFSAIKNARKAGVKHLLTNGTDTASNYRCALIAHDYKDVLAAQGIYPDYVERMSHIQIKEEIKNIAKDKSKIVAIGEVGLDQPGNLKEQRWLFCELIKLANKLNRPLIVHSRGASKQVLAELKKAKVPVVLHYWLGDEKQTKDAVKRGYYFSINPVIFRKPQVEKIVQLVPLDRLLTETDFPYSNYAPADVNQIVDEIARLKKIKSEQAETQIFDNFKNLFLG